MVSETEIRWIIIGDTPVMLTIDESGTVLDTVAATEVVS